MDAVTVTIIVSIVGLLANVLGTLSLLLIRSIVSRVKAIEDDTKDIWKAHNDFKFHVAEHYATNPRLDGVEKQILEALREISRKIDQKADKTNG